LCSSVHDYRAISDVSWGLPALASCPYSDAVRYETATINYSDFYIVSSTLFIPSIATELETQVTPENTLFYVLFLLSFA
jgi:hypothetical protein